MSRPEVAVARSHIGVWREVAAGEHEYALVLDGRCLVSSWVRSSARSGVEEIEADNGCATQLDILYLSYKEVKYGAQKTFLSRNVFRPGRGLWYLSGYILFAQRRYEASDCCLVGDP